jgi:hypothetical protein
MRKRPHGWATSDKLPLITKTIEPRPYTAVFAKSTLVDQNPIGQRGLKTSRRRPTSQTLLQF